MVHLFTYSYVFIHWLTMVCALTGVRTYNLGVSGQSSNQLSYPARAASSTDGLRAVIRVSKDGVGKPPLILVSGNPETLFLPCWLRGRAD